MKCQKVSETKNDIVNNTVDGTVKNTDRIAVSVIVAFYKGNQYMERLFNSIIKVAEGMKDKATFEVILVNDSPGIEIELANMVQQLEEFGGCVKILKNDHNSGIQQTRVNGINGASGEWILILDQDDELVVDGFKSQLELTRSADVVVSNGLYQYGDQMKPIYKSQKAMNYLIQKERFIRIRNLIPSPGECLIRKTVVPLTWMESPLKCNGADDWLLWILLFQEGRRFACNDQIVYIHNDVGGQNLSLDLEKMHRSAIEMCKVLKEKLGAVEWRRLRRTVEFKYLQDTGRLGVIGWWKYRRCVLDNMFYKVRS